MEVAFGIHMHDWSVSSVELCRLNSADESAERTAVCFLEEKPARCQVLPFLLMFVLHLSFGYKSGYVLKLLNCIFLRNFLKISAK